MLLQQSFDSVLEEEQLRQEKTYLEVDFVRDGQEVDLGVVLDLQRVAGTILRSEGTPWST